MIVTTDPDEFMDLTFALSYMPLPPGKRVAVATMGGGWGVLVSDEIARCGLELAELSPGGDRGPEQAAAAVLEPRQPGRHGGDHHARACRRRSWRCWRPATRWTPCIVMGVVGSMSESRRAIDGDRGAEAAAPATARRPENGGGVRAEEAEPELSERELAFIEQIAALMDRYCKPIANISFKPMTQAIFSAGGRYSTFVLPSPLRAVRILGKMAAYSAYPAEEGARACGC